MKTIKYTLACFLLILGSAVAQADNENYTANITVKNSNLVKLRNINLDNTSSPSILSGRLTRSYLSRDIEPGFINAAIVGHDGDIIENQKWELEYLFDGDNDRFSSFEFSLSSSAESIKEIRIAHQGF